MLDLVTGLVDDDEGVLTPFIAEETREAAADDSGVSLVREDDRVSDLSSSSSASASIIGVEDIDLLATADRFSDKDETFLIKRKPADVILCEC